MTKNAMIHLYSLMRLSLLTVSHRVTPSSLLLKPYVAENLLPNWCKYSLHPQLSRALHAKSFLSPTPIQEAALPMAFAGRDVIGVAQTVRLPVGVLHVSNDDSRVLEKL